MDIDASNSIFERIGGEATVRSIVDEFYRRVLNDPALAQAFAGVDMERLRAHQMAFLAAALGGQVDYGGRSMREAHRGLGITRAQFAGVATHLHEALRGIVDTHEIEEILVTVASLQHQIVER